MHVEGPHIDCLLLVEDCQGDADVVCHGLSGARIGYNLTVAGSLAEAFAHLSEKQTDLILLDLTLPDSKGIETLVRTNAAFPQIPIVVLTGHDDDEFGMASISAGAQDYLCKARLTPLNLRRVIGYALSRHREAQSIELRIARQREQALSSSGAEALAGNAPIRVSEPAIFRAFQVKYRTLLDQYMRQLVLHKGKPLKEMDGLVTELGALGATPRDLIDIHAAGLDNIKQGIRRENVYVYAADARLFALEMMGLLAEYYRRRLMGADPGRSSS
jgi:DNA-binding response OmpR family regulator